MPTGVRAKVSGKGSVPVEAGFAGTGGEKTKSSSDPVAGVPWLISHVHCEYEGQQACRVGPPVPSGRAIGAYAARQENTAIKRTDILESPVAFLKNILYIVCRLTMI
jgi:hypothetical protein